MPEKTKNFRSISLGGHLVRDIEDFIKEDGRYKSVAEFVSESARLRMDEINRLYATVEKVGGRVYTPIEKRGAR